MGSKIGIDGRLSWASLLHSATHQPGVISAAFKMFHNYSVGNQLLAMEQCHMRGITPGPISTFVGWKEKNRYVRKGEKAIVLCMPVTAKKRRENPETGETEEDKFTMFLYKANWFVYAQTEGEEIKPEVLPNWSSAKALDTLKISRVAFSSTSGNTMGYASKRDVAINPVCPKPTKILFHEMAHIMLGHCDGGVMEDGEHISRNLKEAEAEAVALIVGESLGLPGADESRGYIQHWYQNCEIPEKSAQRIFKVADQILKAGEV